MRRTITHLVLGFLAASALLYAQTHVVLTNDQTFNAANSNALTGTYSGGTYQNCTIQSTCTVPAGSLTGTVDPTNGGTGANNTPTSGRYLKGDGTDFVTSNGSASGTGTCTNQFARVLNSDAAPTCATVSLTADVTGTLPVANGGTNLSAATDDNTMVGNGTTWQSKALPNCIDSSGNHLNYTAATNAFSCGTTSAANKQAWMAGTGNNNLSGAADNSMAVMGQEAPITGGFAGLGLDAPIAGNATNLRCRVTVVPGAGKSWVFSLSISATPTALACTIQDTGSSCTDTDVVAIAVGDILTYNVGPTGTPAAAQARCSLEFDPT